MINILCNSFSFPSGRILKELILNSTGEKVRLTSRPERLEHLKTFPSVRYGNSFGNFNKDTSLNSKDFIRLCSSKLSFSNLLSENNLYTPAYTKSLDTLTDDIFPVLIRQSLSLSGGRGIILCKNREEFNANNRHNYWTKYIPTEFELRVHIIGGKIARIFRKDLEEEAEFPIRNNQTCHFALKESEKYPKLVDVVNNLNNVFNSNNLNFGFYALDVGWDKSKKQYFIFEANSAPGLNEHTAELYANFIVENLKTERT